MKIAHFISAPASGGAEVLVKDLCSEFTSRGHEVLIIFLSNAEDIGRDKDFEDKLLNNLTSNSISYCFIGNDCRLNPIKGWKRLRKVLSNFNADVLHCHLFYALAFSLFQGLCPVVYTHHSNNIKIPNILFKLLNYKTSKLIGISSECSKTLRGVFPDRVETVMNAVDSSRTIPRLRKFNGDFLKIVMVGRLTLQKNYMLALNAFRILSDKYNFSVEIIGEGPDKALLSDFAKRLDLSDSVSFVGNSSTVSEHLNQADIFLMTSSWEGLPIALIEATLSGLPTVVTNVGGCSEVGHKVLNSVVVDELTPDHIADSLSKFYLDSELLEFLSRNSLKFSEPFDISFSASKHLDIYENL